MGKFGDVGLENLHAQVRLKTDGGTDLDISGFSSMKCRLQLGAADEFTIKMPSQLLDGEWRPDMGQWQQGASIVLEAGYDGDFKKIQGFEVVSTTTNYAESGEESTTIRAVSDLARAARNTESRTFDSGSDSDILTEICTEYGWTNGVIGPLLDPAKRLKKKGTSDLTFLKLIARGAKLGGPRVTSDNLLLMPTPVVGSLRFVRGSPTTPSASEYLRLLGLSMNRDGGASKTLVAVTSWDPEAEKFVKIVFEADVFGGDPVVKYEGVPSTKEIPKESTTQGLVLSVLEQKGQGKNERTDVLSIGRFINEDDAIGLVRRWFELREKISRWATAKLEGHEDLKPFQSFALDGNIAAMDKGDWLPLWIDHNFSAAGWISTARVVRIVDERIVLSPSE